MEQFSKEDQINEDSLEINRKVDLIEEKRDNLDQDKFNCIAPPKLMLNDDLLVEDDDKRQIDYEIPSEHLNENPHVEVQSCVTNCATTTDPSTKRSLPLYPKLICKLCDKHYEDPRLLPCLHTFCAKCINQLKEYIPVNESNLTRRMSSVKRIPKSSSSSSTSLSENKRTILCPICDSEFDVEQDAKTHLPVNYVVQRQVLTLTRKKEFQTTHSECDLCSCDLPVTNKCVDCDCDLCVFCVEAHKRQKKTCAHNVVKLKEKQFNEGSNKKFSSLNCDLHPNEDLNLFCEECLVTLCCSCADAKHRSHSCRFAADICDHQVSHLQDVVAQVKPYADNIKHWMDNISSVSENFDAQVTQVTLQVNQFIDAYIQTLQSHRQNLLSEIKSVQTAKKEEFELQRIQFEQTLEDLQSSFDFTNELVEFGSDIEILTLLKSVLDRFQDLQRIQYKCIKKDEKGIIFNNTDKLNVNGFSLAGTISTKIPPSIRFIVRGDGLLTARQGQWAEVFVTCQDLEGNSMTVLESDIRAILVAKDKSGRCIPVQITNYRNGLYRFSFRPNFSGLFLLHIEYYGKPIQGSPFIIPIKPKWRQHVGIYHCCSFCSSGGSKDAECACSGSMPGGFKGCGHGHKDYPGRKHWSCCGKTIENSECSRPLSKMYTFTI